MVKVWMVNEREFMPEKGNQPQPKKTFWDWFNGKEAGGTHRPNSDQTQLPKETELTSRRFDDAVGEGGASPSAKDRIPQKGRGQRVMSWFGEQNLWKKITLIAVPLVVLLVGVPLILLGQNSNDDWSEPLAWDVRESMISYTGEPRNASSIQSNCRMSNGKDSEYLCTLDTFFSGTFYGKISYRIDVDEGGSYETVSQELSSGSISPELDIYFVPSGRLDSKQEPLFVPLSPLSGIDDLLRGSYEESDDPPEVPSSSSGPDDWPGGSAYTTILASLSSESGALEFKANVVGLDAGILNSSDYASLNPGYWVVFSGTYNSLEDAREGASFAQSLGYRDAYPRFVSQTP